MKKLFVPLGHFYSPLTNDDEIKKYENRLFDKEKKVLAIDFNLKKQKKLLKSFSSFYNEMPFLDSPSVTTRYGFKNNFFSYGDALSLYSMIRYLKPQRIIEVGSGYSSCVTLDTNDLFFNGQIKCEFIEPFPNTLRSVLSRDDFEKISLREEALQSIPLDYFQTLKENDILFIDSTHVSKTGSDVNYLFFEILPRLQKGVYIHFHDILYPFEYPKTWVYEGRSWNEAYLLQSFLQYNVAFEIVFFNSFLGHVCPALLERYLPLFVKNTGGSIWLKKLTSALA
ncbi:MAG: class I SAM-dependent methyltransferase [Alphaproteobacteria bacterium]